MASDDYREKLLQLMRDKGPVVPSDVNRELNVSILIASVMLSDLVGMNKVRISRLKVGGSPLYYLPEHADQLQNFSGKLAGPEKRAYELLREGKMLTDKQLDPQTRVALRQLKDFAVPLEKSHNGSSELLWKWYLLPDDEADAMVHKSVGEEEAVAVAASSFKGALVEVAAAAPAEAVAAEAPAVAVQEKVSEKKQVEPAAPGLKKPRRAAPKKQAEPKQRVDVLQFLSGHNIAVVETLSAKKGDAEFIANVPNPLGGTRYYCRFRDKKSCNDADVSAAIVQAQLKKLPLLFLSTGALSKKAEEVLGSQQNVLFKKVG